MMSHRYYLYSASSASESHDVLAPMNVLATRVDVLDHLLYGAENRNVQLSHLQEKLSDLERAVKGCENNVTDIRFLHEMMEQMKLQSTFVGNSKQVVLELMVKRKDILDTIGSLQEIKKLKGFASAALPVDISQLEQRLTRLEQKIVEESNHVQLHSEKLDSFLDVYHKLIDNFSERCLHMDYKLTEIENAKN